MNLWTVIANHIAIATGTSFVARQVNSQGGGCINTAYILADGMQRYFVKINDANLVTMFEAEADGLRELARSQTVRTPMPILTGVVKNSAFLVLEYLDLMSVKPANMERLGRELAMLHRTTQNYFGWYRDNTIGSTPQHNHGTSDWVEFWCKQRLGFQLHLARGERLLMQRGAALLVALPTFFRNYYPCPSLLHGDLWSGNIAITGTGVPVIFDPAVYYGDREADIAMTELFGGFGERFYAAYNESWPLDSGYQIRKQLYNLYHILNHYHLFGGNYVSQAARMMDQLLSIH